MCALEAGDATPCRRPHSPLSPAWLSFLAWTGVLTRLTALTAVVAILAATARKIAVARRAAASSTGASKEVGPPEFRVGACVCCPASSCCMLTLSTQLGCSRRMSMQAALQRCRSPAAGASALTS